MKEVNCFRFSFKSWRNLNRMVPYACCGPCGTFPLKHHVSSTDTYSWLASKLSKVIYLWLDNFHWFLAETYISKIFISKKVIQERMKSFVRLFVVLIALSTLGCYSFAQIPRDEACKTSTTFSTFNLLTSFHFQMMPSQYELWKHYFWIEHSPFDSTANEQERLDMISRAFERLPPAELERYGRWNKCYWVAISVSTAISIRNQSRMISSY